jgi:hypothetical protein
MQGIIIIIIINTIIQNKFKYKISVILSLQPLSFIALYMQRFSIHSYGNMAIRLRLRVTLGTRATKSLHTKCRDMTTVPQGKKSRLIKHRHSLFILREIR